MVVVVVAVVVVAVAVAVAVAVVAVAVSVAVWGKVKKTLVFIGKTSPLSYLKTTFQKTAARTLLLPVSEYFLLPDLRSRSFNREN